MKRSLSISYLALTVAWAFAAAFAVYYLQYAFTADVNHDEVEHLVIAQRVLSGEIPYRDFTQNHQPYVWFVIAPFVEIIGANVGLVYMVRALSACLFLFSAFFAARFTWRRTSSAWAVLVVLVPIMTVFGPAFQMGWLRPDSFTTAFLVFGFFCMLSAHAFSRRWAFAIGLLIGLALSFTIKPFPLVFAYPCLVFLATNSRLLPIKDRLQLLFLYGVGGIVATIPWLGYMTYYGILADSWFHIVTVNRAYVPDNSLKVSALFNPLILYSIIFIAANSLFRLVRKKGLTQLDTLFYIWFGLTMTSFFIARHHGWYNIQYLLIPAAAFIAVKIGSIIDSTRRPWLQAVLYAVVTSFFLRIYLYEPIPDYSDHTTLPIAKVEQIIALSPDTPEKLTCIGLAPFHMVGCKNPSGVSQYWDYYFSTQLEEDTPAHTHFKNLWGETIAKIKTGTIDVILWKTDLSGRTIWEDLHKQGIISKDDLNSIRYLAEKNYEQKTVAESVTFITRKDRVAF